MKPAVLALLIISTLLAALSAYANETTSKDSAVLDLLSAYELGLKNDATLHAAFSELQASKEAKPQALADLLPNISATAQTEDVRQESLSGFTGGNGKQTSQFRDEGYTVSIRQPLFNWERFTRFKQAKKEVSRAVIKYQQAEQSLILRITERYLNTLTAEANLTLANDNLSAFKQQLKQAKFRFEVGSIAITDVHDAQARHDLALATQITAYNNLDSKREALYEIIQTDALSLSSLNHDFPLTPPQPNNISEWEQTAANKNLAIKAALLDTAIAKRQISINRSKQMPTVDLIASHSYSETGGGSFGTGFTTESDRLGLELNVPLFSGGKNTSIIREAAHLHQASLDALSSLKRTTERETRDAFRGINASLHRIKALQQATLSGESSLQANQAGLEAGTRTLVDVLDAQSNLTLAKFDLIQEKQAYILNVLQLKYAAGSLEKADVERINQWLK
jgi:outer membrane protein